MRWEVVNYGALGMPCGWIAQGLGRLPVRWGGAFEAHMLVMPLYKPIEQHQFNWSLRLTNEAGATGFDNPEPATEEALAADLVRAVNSTGLVYLEKTAHLTGLRDLLRDSEERSRERNRDFSRNEELGYTEILLGDYEAAERHLALGSTPRPDDIGDWVAEMRARCGLVLELLRSDPESARNKLDVWADGSAKALGVTRAAHPLSQE